MFRKNCDENMKKDRLFDLETPLIRQKVLFYCSYFRFHTVAIERFTAEYTVCRPVHSFD